MQEFIRKLNLRFRLDYILQLPQLEELQPAHEPAVPEIGVDVPILSLEKEANREKVRLAVC